MRYNGKRVATVLALTAAAAAYEPAIAFASESAIAPRTAQDWETATTYADVDGDGRPNAVTVREVSADTQTLTFAFPEELVQTSFEADAAAPLQQPRPVDINGDGRDEVVVAHAVGANTITFNIWKYEPGQGIVRLTTSAGAPFEVYEGGGVASIARYGCTPTPAGRHFVTVNAQLAETPDGELRYDGERTTYSVNRNATTVETLTPIHRAPADDPRLAADPASCAP
jgi:hypothetical protein